MSHEKTIARLRRRVHHFRQVMKNLSNWSLQNKYERDALYKAVTDAMANDEKLKRKDPKEAF